jgi:hypothetical protein
MMGKALRLAQLNAHDEQREERHGQLPPICLSLSIHLHTPFGLLSSISQAL